MIIKLNTNKPQSHIIVFNPGDKIPKWAKQIVIDYQYDWVVEKYPEWIIENGGRKIDVTNSNTLLDWNISIEE